jgi:hypothetical protein
MSKPKSVLARGSSVETKAIKNLRARCLCDQFGPPVARISEVRHPHEQRYCREFPDRLRFEASANPPIPRELPRGSRATVASSPSTYSQVFLPHDVGRPSGYYPLWTNFAAHLLVRAGSPAIAARGSTLW